MSTSQVENPAPAHMILEEQFLLTGPGDVCIVPVHRPSVVILLCRAAEGEDRQLDPGNRDVCVKGVVKGRLVLGVGERGWENNGCVFKAC